MREIRVEAEKKQKSKLISGSDYKLLRRIMQYAGPYKKQFYYSAVLAVLLSVLGPLRPYLVELTVDKYILTNDMNGLIIISLISLVVLVAESFCRYYFLYTTNWLGQSVVKNLRIKIFGHIIGSGLGYFDKTPVGISTTRTINDLETINSVFTEGIIQIIADLLTILFVLAFMFYTNWRLALICMVSFPLIIYATYVFKEGIKSTFQTVRTAVAQLNSFLQERITGMKIVQLFNAESVEYENFKKINNEHRRAQVKSVWYYSIFFPVVEIIVALAISLMVWRGAHNVIEGKATIGEIMGFLLYLNLLFRPLRMLADKFNTLQMGVVSGERVFKILDNQAITENTGNNKSVIKGKINFDHVWFAYKDEDWVLKDVNFSIRQNETLAIVGATGAGKSSIISLLSRFYDIQKGSIKIDDAAIHEYDLSSLRGQIGLVLQDVFLFSGSVYENISLRNYHITRQEVIEAAKMLGAHEFIMKLPGGYDYNVMERGATLSLGQRQLISFVRAMVFNPKILILDEATSSVDLETEQVIQNAIENLVTHRTSIIIAHRLSTIQKADRILVLDKGEVKEEGTHEELLRINGYYKKLYEMQFVKNLDAV